MPKYQQEYELKDHQLFASSRQLWQTLKAENDIAESKMKLARKISLVIASLGIFRVLQRLFLKARIKDNELKDDTPIFVIGHWRSGTTHLHYLLSQDSRYMHLSSFQAFFFNVAFTTRWFFKPILKRVMPETRPQDNVKIDADAPTEEEHALVNITKMSGMHMFFFPKNLTYFDKYNCFEGISNKELQEWKSIYSNLLKQIEVFNKVDKKLLLKNPHNTGRLKVLHEMYPKAKFIFIHRNPYDVFRSTITLYERAVKTQFLQEFRDKELDELVLHCYEKMMSKYLEQRHMIPANQLIEVGYDQLVDNPINELERIYTQLDLGGFENVKPQLNAYIKTLKSYQVNPKVDVDTEIKDQIKTRWDFAFKEWGYQK
jgi:omega-hydroxy-beta-dihydromenaquinone-9 sulfotransferase